MHDGFACIHSRTVSYLGYVVKLEVNYKHSDTHVRNLGRHIQAAIQENTDVSYGLLEHYVKSTHVGVGHGRRNFTSRHIKGSVFD